MSSINLNNINACKEAYVNYYYDNNTKNISENDINEIEARYKTELKGWKADVSNDKNVYDIEDDSQEDSQSKSNSKKASSRSKASLGIAAASAVGGAVAVNLANKAAMNVIRGSQSGFSEAGKSIAEQANNKSAMGFIVECTLGLANGTLYQASKPNKDEHKELMEIETQMQDYLSNLEEEQSVMEEDVETVESIVEVADAVEEESAESIEELQKEYEEKLVRQEELKAKIDSGEPLTEEESREYEQLGDDLSTLSEKISKLSEDSTDEIEEITEDAETVQEDLDSTAETVENIQDKADYAASFDNSTQEMCIVESVAQGINVLSSTKGAVDAFKFAQAGATLFGSTLWANAFGAMGVAGAAMSAAGVAEQIKMSSEIGKEIDVRKEVQSLNTEVADIQSETADALTDATDNIEEITTDIEDTDIPEVETIDTPASLNTELVLEDEDKKTEEEHTR